jgi:hypothetical protein
MQKDKSEIDCGDIDSLNQSTCLFKNPIYMREEKLISSEFANISNEMDKRL